MRGISVRKTILMKSSSLVVRLDAVFDVGILYISSLH